MKVTQRALRPFSPCARCGATGFLKPLILEKAMAFVKSIPEAEESVAAVMRRYPAQAIALTELTNIIMRTGDCAFTSEQRELIAAYSSGLNDCTYCYNTHKATAEAFGVDENLLESIVLPENTYGLIFLTFFRDAINLVSSVIVRIQNHETHCLRTVTACVYRDPFANFAATRDCGTAT
jgi:AhpD family alkylhydroperoxidase